MKIWSSLCSLENDPHPEVENLAKTVTQHVNSLVKEPKDVVDSKSNPFVSLPSSPNKNNFLSGESPPTFHSDVPKLSRNLGYRARKIHPQIINEESEDKVKLRKPLVNTKFIEWSVKRFAQPVKRRRGNDDVESNSYYEKEWRFAR